MVINSKFNVGDHVMVYNQRKGVVKSFKTFDDRGCGYDKMYLVLHTDNDEEVWYQENHLNILIGDVYLTE